MLKGRSTGGKAEAGLQLHPSAFDFSIQHSAFSIGNVELRRHHHRRRPQRARQRGLPGSRRPEGAGPRAASPGRWCGSHRGSVPGVQVLGLLVRRLAAPPGDHQGARPAAARSRDPSARWDVHADAERRLPVAGQRSRADAPRDCASFEGRRRGIRRVRQGDGRHGPVRQTHPRHDAARPDIPRPARPARSALARPALPGALRRATSTTRFSS